MNVAVSRDSSRLYILIGAAVLLVALIGFSPTYYLRSWFDAPSLTVRLHMHGLVLTLWLVLFIVQSLLIPAGRRSLHRRLGFAGVGLAGAVIVATFMTALESARLDGSRGGITAADRLYSTVVILALFALFVAVGTWFRRRPDIHKRSMLLATIAIVGPAASRAALLLIGRAVRDPHVIVMSALLLTAVVSDWRTRGRVHWWLLCGALLLIASQLTRRFVGGTEAWTLIGNWLIG
jgi:hypothetical protein